MTNDINEIDKWYDLEPNIWGNHAWIFLHSITLSYPDNPSNETKNKVKDFFESIILPCSTCRTHYSNNLKQYPLTDNILSSRKNMIEWLVNVHNSVNKWNNKPIMSLEDVIKKYYKLYNNGIVRDYYIKVNITRIFLSIGIFGIIIMILYLFITKKINNV